MLRKYFILLIIFLPLAANAKKMILPIPIVALKADLIVEGKIESLNKNSYKFKVSKVVKGKTSSATITVDKWGEWECDTRRHKYEVGQKLVLFLLKSGNKFIVIDGSTGELFIEDNNLTLLYYDTTISKNDFYSIVNAIISCYKLIKEPDLYSKGKAVTKTCQQVDDKSISNKKLLTRFEEQLKWYM